MLVDTNFLLVVSVLILGAFYPRAAFAVLAGYFIAHHWPVFY